MNGHTVLFNFDSIPWAVDPSVFNGIRNLLETCDSPDRFGQSMQAIFSIPPEDELQPETPYRLVDGVAIVAAVGTITKRTSWWARYFGGSSWFGIVEALNAAENDDDVKAVVLDFDSPGGSVDGTKYARDFIREMKKPVVTFANGTLASGAVWAGSAAQRIFTTATAQMGSIGVLMIHRDFSRMDGERGITTTPLHAGQHKIDGLPEVPLTDQARTEIQGRLDYFYAMFLADLVENYGVSAEAVSRMAEGRVFIGQAAVNVGLAHEIGELGDAVNYAAGVADGTIDLVADDSLQPEEQVETDQEPAAVLRPADYGAMAIVDQLTTARAALLDLVSGK